jgi:two-component system, OmpR family, phosphate regulon sensor histidine kinase PhoR
MLRRLAENFKANTNTAVLTAAVLGALLLQLNLLSGQLELQRQQFEQQVGTASTSLNERVRLYVRRKSVGLLKSSNTKDSTVTINTPMGQTTLSWSSGQQELTSGFGDSSMISGFFENFQNSLPWAAQLTDLEMDSIITAQLKINGVRTAPKWAIVENGYLSQLGSQEFEPGQTTFNYVLAESFFGPTRQLLLYFPSERVYLARSVYLSLIASLLFSAVILVAFFGVQRQGRKQKRLALVKSDFINNMSHEFKTPLATINLAVDALMKNGEQMTPEQMQSYLSIVKKENKRMNAQMESVLQMSMLDKEELTLDRSIIDVSEVLQEAVNHFKLAVEERQGWIDLNLAQGNYQYFGDRTQFKSALTNLIDNAVKYSEAIPRISVQLSESDTSFNIFIKDRGIGMDEDTQYQVFDRFYRATKGNIHDVKGHGLGLSFVKDIIEKHGGVISLKSQIGQGTTFTIELNKNSGDD